MVSTAEKQQRLPARTQIAKACSWSDAAGTIIDALENGTAEDRHYVKGLLKSLCLIADNLQSGGARSPEGGGNPSDL